MSLANTLITRVALPLRGGKRRLSSERRTRRHIETRRLRPVAYAPPRGLDRRATVTLEHHDGWPIYTLEPRGRSPRATVLYLHGGAYVNEILRTHWTALGKLTAQVPARCVVPI